MGRLTSKSFKVTGIVIGKRNFFESDKIIEILTLEKGKIRCVVKGARKPTSKLAGGTELFTYGVFSLANGKNLDILTSATPKNHFQKASGNLKDVSQLFLVSEALGKLIPQEVPNETIFNETLEVFKSVNDNHKPYIIYEYLYKLIVLLGYGLSLDVCARCHTDITTLGAKNTISINLGGLLCEKCQTDYHSSRTFSEGSIKLLKYIENYPIDEYVKITFADDLGEELKRLINLYLNFIYQHELKSPRFIKSIEALK